MYAGMHKGNMIDYAGPDKSGNNNGRIVELGKNQMLKGALQNVQYLTTRLGVLCLQLASLTIIHNRCRESDNWPLPENTIAHSYSA